MLRCIIAWIAALVLLAPLACGRSSPPTPNYVVRDSAGIEIVENPALAPDPGRWQVLSDEPLLEIGAVEGEDAFLFDRITAARRLSDGRILVLNSGSQEIRFFRADGHHLRTVGGRGEGPGEFQFAMGLFQYSPDTILVPDMRRLNWFDLDGHFARSAQLDWDGVRQMMLPVFLGSGLPMSDGSFMAGGETGDRRPPPEGVTRPPQPFFRISPGFDAVDTLGIYPGIEQINMGTHDRPMFYVLPYAKATVWGMGGNPTFVYISSNDAREVHQYDVTGRLVRLIRVDQPRRPLRPRDIQQWKDDFRSRFTRQPDRLPSIDRALADLPQPDSFPAYARFVVARDGSLWAGEAGPRDEAMPYSVFDVAGRRMGYVAVPSGFTVMDIGADYVLGVHRDAMEVEFVRLYELRPG
jgi:hypothetical protein